MFRFRFEGARRGAPRKLRAALWSLALVGGCRLLKPGVSPDDPLPPPEPASTVPARVEVRDVEFRPRLALVARQGDPAGAVALAVAHDLGARASLAIGELVRGRLEQRGIGIQANAHGLGFHVASLVESPDAAARFVTAASEALQEPVEASEPALRGLAEALEALRGRPRAGEAEGAVAACSGEIVAEASEAAIDPKSAADLKRLEDWRRRMAVAPGVAVAAVGRSSVLDAAAQALHRVPAWPTEPAPEDAWPSGDQLGFTPIAEGDRPLLVALRVGEPSQALQAAEALDRSGSMLAARLEALDPSFKLERAFATLRPRGACLRVEVATQRGATPKPAEVARAAAIVVDEAQAAVAAAPKSEWVLDQRVLRPADPRDSAAVAAWRSLSGRLPPGEPRVYVSAGSEARAPDPKADAELRRLFAAAERHAAKSSLDTRVRAEPGQGELWALLATPCGTSGESQAQAGLGALLVSTLARPRRRTGDVEIEPWISADGYGLLAHGPRRGPNESPRAHAERVATALGKALAGTRTTSAEVASARRRLLADLGQPRPGFDALLGALAPDRPSWLDPRGTWASLGELSASSVEAERRAFIGEPLRLAVIANWDDEQGQHLSRALDRWLGPLRGEASAGCSAPDRPIPRPGEYRVLTGGEAPVSAYVAVTLPPSAELHRQEAEWTVHLLNRDGGWLDQALRLPGLASSARATLLGGPRISAIAIAVRAVDDGRDAAVAQIRALLERLATGAATAADVQAARAAYVSGRRTALLDPRRRLVELWEDDDPLPAPDLASLRKLHRALAPDQHVVVRVDERQ